MVLRRIVWPMLPAPATEPMKATRSGVANRSIARLSAGIAELYRYSMNAAFAEKEAFLVTGAPHASAYYPRDFAWFYPDVLDPETVMDSSNVPTFIATSNSTVEPTVIGIASRLSVVKPERVYSRLYVPGGRTGNR